MNIPTDIYNPDNFDILDNWQGITILILQGVEVDKKEYQYLASELTKKGFRVIVPNFYKPGNYFCPDFDSVANFLEFQETLTPGFQESLQNRFVLLGHSAGGIAAVKTFDTHSPPLKIQPLAVINYASYALKIEEKQRELPPILVISGFEDTLITPNMAKLGFENLSGQNKTLIQLANFDHFSITNTGTLKEDGNKNVKPSIYGLEAAQILTQIINEFILGCLNNSPWQANLDLDVIQEI